MIYLISSLGAPATVMIAVAVMGVGGLLVARRAGRVPTGIASLIFIMAIVLIVAPGLLPAQRLDTSKVAPQPGLEVKSGWGPVIRVDVTRVPGDPNVLDLYHDGILGAGILRWDGKISDLSQYNFGQDPRSIPFRVLASGAQQRSGDRSRRRSRGLDVLVLRRRTC